MVAAASSIKATKPKTTTGINLALSAALAALMVFGLQFLTGKKSSSNTSQGSTIQAVGPSPAGNMATNTELATFAAGCFWSVELAFQRVPGVVKTAVGYTQGKTENPTYRDVCNGGTGHVEAVLVEYDPSQVSYDTLLEVFWHKHDPTQKDKQGNDWGSQYRSGIYFHTPEQEKTAKASLEAEQAKYTKKIWTEILPAAKFYMAEEYHQQYLEKGGRNGRKQSASKGCSDPIRCYG